MNQEGKNYEKLLNRDVRKSMGKFYTPDYIIDYILSMTLKKIDVLKDPFVKVLDPSCGTGFFLIKTYDILRQKFEEKILELNSIYSKEKYTIVENNSLSSIKGNEYWKKHRIHYHILKNCIYGTDIDEEALVIARKALMDKGEYRQDNLNLLNCDSLIMWEKISFEEYKYFSLDCSEDNYNELRSFWSNEFDYIIGNPPFVVLLKSKIDKIYWEYIENNYKTLGYKKNIFYLLMERSIDKLKSGGVHSFIIPDRYFLSRSYVNSRRKILTDTKIINITNFTGKVFDKAVVGISSYVLEKNKPAKNHCFDLSINCDNSKVAQKDIFKEKDLMINIITRNKHITLISKIKFQADCLGDYCNAHVGMMIKDKDRHFSESLLNENRQRIVIGRDLSEFVILNNNRYCVLENAIIFGGTKNKDKQSKFPKLLLRKTGDKIIAAIDEEGIYAEQSVYLVIPKDNSMVYGLLGQLSSKLCNYFYRESLVSNPREYPYIQHYDVLKLPINSNLLTDDYFTSLIKEMILIKKNINSINLKQREYELKERINNIVYKAYGLNLSEIKTIEECS